jgi:hypothetical protein
MRKSTKLFVLIVATIAFVAAEQKATLAAGFCYPDQASCTTPLFHGVYNDCEADNLGGHLPQGFMCRGIGTGVGICANSDDKRLISYTVQGGSYNLCHLDWMNVSQAQREATFQYLRCKDAMPVCATAAFGNR